MAEDIRGETYPQRRLKICTPEDRDFDQAGPVLFALAVFGFFTFLIIRNATPNEVLNALKWVGIVLGVGIAGGVVVAGLLIATAYGIATVRCRLLDRESGLSGTQEGV